MPTTRAPARAANWPTSAPTAPEAPLMTKVSPGLTVMYLVRVPQAVIPGPPITLRAVERGRASSYRPGSSLR